MSGGKARLVAVLLVSLTACSKADPLEQRANELTAQLDIAKAAEAEGQKAYRSSEGQPEGRRLAAKLRAETAARLNLEGFVCAEIVDTTPLPGTRDLVVTCLEDSAGTGTARYRLDGSTGTPTRL